MARADDLLRVERGGPGHRLRRHRSRYQERRRHLRTRLECQLPRLHRSRRAPREGDALRRLDVTALATLSAQESTIATPSTPGPPRLLTTRYTTPSEMPVPAWKMNWSLDAGSEFTEIPIPCFVLFFSCLCS
jgi:hypothetical protein